VSSSEGEESEEDEEDEEDEEEGQDEAEAEDALDGDGEGSDGAHGAAGVDHDVCSESDGSDSNASYSTCTSSDTSSESEDSDDDGDDLDPEDLALVASASAEPALSSSAVPMRLEETVRSRVDCVVGTAGVLSVPPAADQHEEQKAPVEKAPLHMHHPTATLPVYDFSAGKKRPADGDGEDP